VAECNIRARLSLDDNYDERHKQEDPVVEERCKYVEVFWSDDSAVNLVEERKEDESIEDYRVVLLLGGSITSVVG
jgi:hypothetical protein